ncbi:uncharacterized protein DUF4181 [Bacillus oleivorans]|uniref:Uncharacterized protein DUF4181 n=1 Tax=Bacillus oleivorans TaxID=1448271 RepID=A0A285CIH4_9BACI|nr:DUF4181 domain-containing protein [Bacillus oleivorans]SNX67320.1 uncharacterized protein DUF4181 [Bacillus oleivorans]
MEPFELILILLVILLVSDWFLKKKFQITSREPYFYKPINKVQRYGEIIIHIIFWIVFPIVMARESGILFWTWIFLYLTFLSGFRFTMEWKYEREKRQYLLTTSKFIWIILFISSIIYLT